MAKHRIVLLDIFPEPYVDAIRADVPDGFELHMIQTYDPQEMMAAIRAADYLVVGGDVSLTGDLLAAAVNVKLIAKRGVGHERIDVAGAAKKGIPVSITPVRSTSQTVAEHTVLLILALLRKVGHLDALVRKGGWRNDIDTCTYQLAGKTVGIVGLGRIGREVARRLAAFDAAVTYCGSSRAEPRTEAELGVEFRPLEELLRQSDVVTLHPRLTPATRNLIGARELAMMKPTAVLVNTARGAVVDEPALIDALRSGRIMGAGLDVFAGEPPAPDNPLLRMPNVVLTPHWAVGDIDTIRDQLRRGFSNILKASRGEALPATDLVPGSARSPTHGPGGEGENG